MAELAHSDDLVAVDDPELPRRSSAIEDLSLAEKLSETASLAGIGAAFAVASWLLFHLGLRWWGLLSGAIALFAFAAALAPKNHKAACPFCGALNRHIPDRKDGRQVRCEQCSDYSVVQRSRLVPLDPAMTTRTDTFECPALLNPRWPNACVVCGGTPTRRDDLTETSLNLARSAMGVLSLNRGTIGGIPYCDGHKQALTLRVDVEKKMFIVWPSLRMMRRFLAANRAGKG